MVNKKGNLVIKVNDNQAIELKDVLFVPELEKNLLSEVALQRQNKLVKFGNKWECHPMINDDEKNPTFGPPLVIEKSPQDDGFYLEAKDQMQQANMSKVVKKGDKKIDQIDVNYAHECLGHIPEDSLKLLAKWNNWSYIGDF